jgi:2-polyprenyl-3-methyl-5-hydroxy-6-metoxy-1,4-benzoquinol methylase
MIAGNPDVESVIGVDNDPQAIGWARENFSHKKITYLQQDAEDFKQKFDTLVCLETIEHIKDKSIVPKIVEQCEIDNIIVSFPDKKTTHYNPHHLHDFVKQDIVDLFPQHVVYHTVRFVDSVSILMIRLPEKAPHDLFRNIRDL